MTNIDSVKKLFNTSSSRVEKKVAYINRPNHMNKIFEYRKLNRSFLKFGKTKLEKRKTAMNVVNIILYQFSILQQFNTIKRSSQKIIPEK